MRNMMLSFMTLSRDSKGWAYRCPLWEPLAFLPNRPARVDGGSKCSVLWAKEVMHYSLSFVRLWD